jgi:hypothetical protein
MSKNIKRSKSQYQSSPPLYATNDGWDTVPLVLMENGTEYKKNIEQIGLNANETGFAVKFRENKKKIKISSCSWKTWN